MNHTRDILTSPRVIELKKKRRQVKIRRLIIFLIFFISITIGASFLSQYKRITINKINISGINVIEEGDILKIIDKNISGKYLFLFSKKNVFIFPKSKIYDDLTFSFPRIEKLTINQENFNTLNIKIMERSGSYLWCGEFIPIVEEEIGENCYFINSEGYIFDEAPYFSGNLYLKFYIPLNLTEDSPLAKQVLPKEEFGSLMAFIDKIISLGLEPIYIIFNADNTCEIYLKHKKGDTSPKIVFSNEDRNNEGLRKLSENLTLAMQKSKFSSEIKDNYSKLLYIDLQFKNKILYKFK